MRYFELICTLFTILAGFWKLCRTLNKIELAINNKVGYRECKERQESCPCRKDIEQIKRDIDENHPRKK